MRLRHFAPAITLSWIALLLPSVAGAQGTAADYQRANGLRAKYESLAIGMAGPASWIEDTTRFTYRRSVKGGHEFVLVDAETQQKRPAFDHEKVASSLSKLTGRKYTATTLPFGTITFRDGERTLEVRFDGAVWKCSVSDFSCTRSEPTGAFARRQAPPPCTPPSPDDKPTVSPDGKWEALINNYNVALREAGA